MTPPRKHVALFRHKSHRGEGERFAEFVACYFAEDLVADFAAAAEVGYV
jgi:hypothetical protein